MLLHPGNLFQMKGEFFLSFFFHPRLQDLHDNCVFAAPKPPGPFSWEVTAGAFVYVCVPVLYYKVRRKLRS